MNWGGQRRFQPFRLLLCALVNHSLWTYWCKMRIGHKSILGFVGIALLIWIVGYISVNTSQKALKKTIGENSVALANQVMDSIDRDIHSKIERLQGFADPSLQKVLIKSNQEFERLDNIQNYVNEKEREWTSVPKEEITPFMKELNNNELSKALRKRTRFYEEKYGFSVFPEVFVTNKYGANAAQSGRTSDYRQDDEEWWQRAEKDGLYVGDVEYDESAATHSIAIGMRIDDEEGNFVGIMKAPLNIGEVINIIKTIEATHKHETVEFKLITKGRKIIYSTEESELFEQIPDEFLSTFGCSTGKHVEYFISEGDKPGESEELFAHAHSKGHRDFKGLGWILIVEHKTEEIFAPVAKLKNILLIISFIVTTSAVLIGLFISRSISAPIKKLKAATAEIGKGKLDTKIDINSKNEIGKLAQSFEKMRGDLKTSTTSIDNLNKEIAERKQTEHLLRESEARYRTLYESSRDAIMIITPPTWKFVAGNQATLELFGAQSEEEFITKGAWDISPEYQPDGQLSSEKAKDAIEKAMKEGSNFFEWQHMKLDGKEFSATVLLTRVDLEGRELLQATVRDITERKQAEEGIETAYEQLEQSNMELKEMQSQMVQNEKLASIGQLAAGVAHEMNTPVGFVASNFQTLESYVKKFTDLLKMHDELAGIIETTEKTELLDKANVISQSRDDMKIDFMLEDLQELFDDSKEGLGRITDIIQNLRDFSRIDQPGSLDEFNINDGIESTLVVANNEIKYDADIKMDLSKVPPVFCHSSQINQVFLNILLNASQAIKSKKKDDKGTITIRTYPMDDQVVCEIFDNGCGIAPENLSKIFDPFFTTKVVGEGTGLGLSVSYDIIVNKHKGELLADSTVGEGTTFTIKLPIGTKENDEKEMINDGKKNHAIC